MLKLPHLSRLHWQQFVLGLLVGCPWAYAFSPFEHWWLGLGLLVLWPQLQSRLYRSRSESNRSPIFGQHRRLRWSWFMGGLGFGLSAYGLGTYWLYTSLHTYGGLPAPLAVAALFAFALYLGLFSGLASYLYAHCLHLGPLATDHSRIRATVINARRSPSLPWMWAGFWTFFEWLRGTFLTGFSWLSLGDALVDSPFEPLLAWLGSYGTLFLVLGVLGTALQVMVSAAREDWSALLNNGLTLLVSAGATLVLFQMPVVTQPTQAWRVTGVQTNVDQSIKFDPLQIAANMEKIFKQTESALAQYPEASTLLMPEIVTPLVWSDQPINWLAQFKQYAAQSGQGLIMGVALKQDKRYFNSAVLLNGNETDSALHNPQNAHHKRHLVPFGEFIPPGFRWFVNLMNIPLGEFNRGEGPMQPFVFGANRIMSTVCYEDTFAGEVASLTREASAEPSVMLNLNNLAWFGQSWALDQHAQMGRTRSSELRKPTVRISNTGLSGVIDARGQWMLKVPSGQAQQWSAAPVGQLGLTPFAQWGENIWFVMWGCVLVVFLCRKRALKAYNSKLKHKP